MKNPLYLLVLAMLIHLPSWADSAHLLELKDLVRLAGRIDVVRCLAINSHWQGSNIVTDNYLIIDSTVKPRNLSWAPKSCVIHWCD